eukprot:6198818-Pleurochrysis_carterae.AAC.3
MENHFKLLLCLRLSRPASSALRRWLKSELQSTRSQVRQASRRGGGHSLSPMHPQCKKEYLLNMCALMRGTQT